MRGAIIDEYETLSARFHVQFHWLDVCSGALQTYRCAEALKVENFSGFDGSKGPVATHAIHNSFWKWITSPQSLQRLMQMSHKKHACALHITGYITYHTDNSVIFYRMLLLCM